jgi:hypothetical protein
VLGGLTGLAIHRLLDGDPDDLVGAAGIGILGGTALGAITPMPLSEALARAAEQCSLKLVSFQRTGARGARLTVQAGGVFHSAIVKAVAGKSRDEIDDQIYSAFAQWMVGVVRR